MRDPNRIQKIINLIQEEWYNNPDLRFFQFIEVIGKRISKERDKFYIEDDELMTFLMKRKEEIN